MERMYGRRLLQYHESSRSSLTKYPNGREYAVIAWMIQCVMEMYAIMSDKHCDCDSWK